MTLKRSSGSIVVVIVILGVFFLFAMGVLFHSSGERKHVRTMQQHQSAERVAMSGIDWAEGELEALPYATDARGAAAIARGKQSDDPL